MPADLLRTTLCDTHKSLGGRMVPFAGWEMPVQYTSIVKEHAAVRTAVGLFDTGHMGRLWINGPAATQFLNETLTCDVPSIALGRVSYSLVTNDNGGTLDDVLLTNLGDQWLLVVNASNRDKIVAWLRARCPATGVTIDDRTLNTGMIAVQGPSAVATVEKLLGTALADIPYFGVRQVSSDFLVSRTGYTGEDGVELFVPASDAPDYWSRLTALGATPCGLGARDTLRLESAMPLYGHELSEDIDPITAGLGFAVKLDKGTDFPGRAALAAIKSNPARKRRIGVELSSRRIAREGTPVLMNGATVGTVTSGTFSPTLEKSIAMALVDATVGPAGSSVSLDIRGTLEPATVVKLPFYKRQK
jgi:aminomethyltransferase